MVALNPKYAANSSMLSCSFDNNWIISNRTGLASALYTSK